MLKKVLLMAALVVLLAASLTGAGCASGSALTDVVAKVPGDTASLKYVDVSALRNDDDLAELYDDWKVAVDARMDSHGITSSDVNVFALGTGTGTRFTLLEGDFDLDQVRDKLEGAGFDKGEYKGVELWEAGGGYDSDPRVALMDDLIILGNEAGVEGCIKVIKEGDTSWLKKVDIKDVVDRIPAGLYVDLEKNEVTGLIVKGFEAYGLSAQKEDSDTLDIAGVAKFEDEDEADDGDDAIETMLEIWFEDVDVTQDKSFLTAAAELDIDNAGFLFNGM
jgi:hypothetical protein